MITRADFIGFNVLGPSQRAYSNYAIKGASAWPKGWTADIQGPSLILEGEGRRIEVPRARCVVYTDGVATSVEPKAKSK